MNPEPVSTGANGGAQTAVAPQARQNQTDHEKQKAEVFKKVQAAIDEARREGRTTVDVYLDEDPEKVQTMDLVRIAYLARMEDGREIPPQADARTDGAGRVVETLIAGEPSRIPGLGKAILNMGLGKKPVTIPAEDAFGAYKEDELLEFHSVRTFPVVMDLDAKAYENRFGKRASIGERVKLNPYFDSRVTGVQDGTVRIENFARNNYKEKSDIGITTVTVDSKIITLTLAPVIGAPFSAGQKKGRIISKNADSFIVDFNPPLTGKAIQVDLEVMEIIKPSLYQDAHITWIDDHDKGVDTALADRKNKVLVLYADWCTWCKKLLNQTFNDPRIGMLKDRFVFVKANSDEDRSLKELYDQTGFPMVVITDYKGKIYKKFEGFKNAQSMLGILEQIMNAGPVDADS
ncbi:MAG: thioredoxin family protein [Desulfobacter sp.]|nr:MAG: thioredoxin family protein [Desulfobacter sp.]